MKLLTPLVVLATIVLGLLLVYLHQVAIPAEADGFRSFDVTPHDTSGALGIAFLEALTVSGRDMILTWVRPMDLAFIGLIWLSLMLVALTRTRGYAWIVVGIFATVYAAVDLIENRLSESLIERAPIETAISHLEIILWIGWATRVKFMALITALALVVLFRNRSEEGS